MNIRPFLHPKAQIRVEKVGHQAATVVVIDNFLLDADRLADYAANEAKFSPGGALYPGIQAPIPAPYPMFVHFFTRRMIPEAFGLGALDVVDCRSNFAIITKRPEEVGVRQLVPHMDMLDPNHIVFLHYLFDDPLGGTALYRHRGTGYEWMTEDQRPRYEAMLKDDLAAHPPKDYIRGDTPLFERIGHYPAVFNRAILYRSTSLHAACVPEGFDYDPNPKTGRLTANTVFYYGDQAGFFGPPR